MRPTKQGLDYFPLDIDLDQDDKLSMVIGEFGEKGELIFLKLLGWIYKHNGYYVEWNEIEQLKFAKRVSYIGGASVNLIKEIVVRCIKWGLFDNTVFVSFQILTSSRIQKTWVDASRKRKERVIDNKIWIIGVIDGVKEEKTLLIPPETPQSKVKKSKVNEAIASGGKNDGFVRFEKWIHEHAERVCKMQNPFREPEYEQLKKDFTHDQICELLIAMHNYKALISKNVSAYLTFLNWAKRRDWVTQPAPTQTNTPLATAERLAKYGND